MSRFLLGVTMVVVVVVVGACSDDDDGQVSEPTSTVASTTTMAGEPTPTVESTATTTPSAPSSTAPPATTVTPTTTIPPVVAPVGELVWTQAGAPGPDGTVRSVIAGGPGLIAVGEEDGAAAWFSADGGETWQHAQIEATDDPTVTHTRMNAVIAGGPGYLAVGDRTHRGPQVYSAGVWVSRDGTQWERVDAPDLEEGVVEMWDVERTGAGFVAVGIEVHERSVEADLAVWVSADGLEWRRTSQAELTGPAQEAIYDDNGPFIAALDGGLVAVGTETIDPLNGVVTPVVWTSEDGLIWERVQTSGFKPGQTVSAVVTAGDRLVAVGTDYDDRDVAVWTSTDAVVWDRADQVAFARPRDQQGMSVTPFGNEIVVVGWDHDPQRDLIWHSDYGFTWQLITQGEFEQLGVPRAALWHNEEIIVLGSGRPALFGRPPD